MSWHYHCCLPQKSGNKPFPLPCSHVLLCLTFLSLKVTSPTQAADIPALIGPHLCFFHLFCAFIYIKKDRKQATLHVHAGIAEDGASKQHIAGSCWCACGRAAATATWWCSGSCGFATLRKPTGVLRAEKGFEDTHREK